SRHAEDELTREVAAHLGLLEDEFRRNGMNSDEARFAARRAFGGVEQTKELHRDARSFVWLEHLREDVWHAIRSLFWDRRFTLTAISLLALTIGITTAMYATVRAVILQPMPFADQSQTVVIWERDVRRNAPVVEVALGEADAWGRDSAV